MQEQRKDDGYLTVFFTLVILIGALVLAIFCAVKFTEWLKSDKSLAETAGSAAAAVAKPVAEKAKEAADEFKKGWDK